MSGYVFESEWDQEKRRLAGIEATFDGFTAAAFDRIGIEAGWRCLDVGAGGGSVARILAERGASVVASDLDTRHLEKLDHPRVEVLRYDVLADDLDPESFDLVHARMVLEHIPERDVALGRMLETVKRGGWLVVEDLVLAEEELAAGMMLLWPESLGEVFRIARLAVLSRMTAAGFDGGYARRLPRVFLSLGLHNVGCELRSKLIRGGSAEASFNELSLMQLRDTLVASRLLTDDQAATALQAMQDAKSAWMTPPLMSTWGRKPL